MNWWMSIVASWHGHLSVAYSLVHQCLFPGKPAEKPAHEPHEAPRLDALPVETAGAVVSYRGIIPAISMVRAVQALSSSGLRRTPESGLAVAMVSNCLLCSLRPLVGGIRLYWVLAPFLSIWPRSQRCAGAAPYSTEGKLLLTRSMIRCSCPPGWLIKVLATVRLQPPVGCVFCVALIRGHAGAVLGCQRSWTSRR